MTDETTQQLNEELSQLVREYEEQGLGPEQIGEALHWHAQLAVSRSTDSTASQRDRVRVSDD